MKKVYIVAVYVLVYTSENHVHKWITSFVICESTVVSSYQKLYIFKYTIMWFFILQFIAPLS
jgi:hypothetical protein